VRGESMVPTLQAGDRAVAIRPLRVRPGHLVVLRDPSQPSRTLVKRALWLGWQPRFRRVVWVEGDNPAASTDSRDFGSIPRRQVRAVLVWIYYPAQRSGRAELRPL
jgi:signal peptidase I